MVHSPELHVLRSAFRSNPFNFFSARLDDMAEFLCTEQPKLFLWCALGVCFCDKSLGTGHFCDLRKGRKVMVVVVVVCAANERGARLKFI